MQEGVEAISKFIVTGSDTAKLFEAVEEALNQVAYLVSLTVVLKRRQSVAARRDDCLSTNRAYAFDKRTLSYPLSAMTASVAMDSSNAGPCVTS